MNKQPIYMVIGCPGSGKSWCCEQVQHKFVYCHHDLFIGQAGDKYVQSILRRAATAQKPLLIEAPFSVSQIMDPLKQRGFKVTPLFIIESAKTLSDRYWKREKKPIPQGHITRTKTYFERALKLGAFYGTSEQVLDELRRI